jgi:hypothetical protein
MEPPKIILKRNALTFFFNDIAEEVRPLIETCTQTVLTHIIAQGPGPLLAALEEAWSYQDAKPEKREEMRSYVRNLTPAQIEAGWREACAYEIAGTHAYCWATIGFQRTLRIPDDGKLYPLPAGFGYFPLRHIDDFADRVPQAWLERGGVLLPMYQSEALWTYFDASYPCAIKFGTGKINAVTGEGWAPGLQGPSNPERCEQIGEDQNYLVAPGQPWLDGFAVGRGVIRQFVAMPLGQGYSVEEQVTGKADVGGIQLQVYPMKAETYVRETVQPALEAAIPQLLSRLMPQPFYREKPDFAEYCCDFAEADTSLYAGKPREMGLGAGGKMRQEIYADPHGVDAWDTTRTRRCFIHLCNSLSWREITGDNPPYPPFTAREYQRARLPWFDYYRDDLAVLDGSPILQKVKSVAQIAATNGASPLPGEAPISPELIIQYGNTRRPDEVREWSEL